MRGERKLSSVMRGGEICMSLGSALIAAGDDLTPQVAALKSPKDLVTDSLLIAGLFIDMYPLCRSSVTRGEGMGAGGTGV